MKAAVKDKAAFESSQATIRDWDFDRVIVGHGDVIEFEGKVKLHAALAAAGFSPGTKWTPSATVIAQ